MPFGQALRTKILLWCDRHCCLCKRACGINIEVHHIVPEAEGGSNEIDNAIPLCFDCHGTVQHYNPRHPIGTMYRVEELKPRREQVYEEFTRHLVPPVHYEVTQALPDGDSRQFPDVGFVLSHFGDSLPVKVRVIIEIVENDGRLNRFSRGHYSGDKLWHLNPRFVVSGHFNIPMEAQSRSDPLKLRVSVSIIDQYDREHFHLRVEYVYVADRNYWYAEP